MSLKFYDAYLTVAGTPMDNYKNDLQELVNEQFDNASDVYEIQKENPITGEYEPIVVRLTKGTTRAVSQSNSYILDDFKKVIFQNFSTITYLGDQFQFSDYTWLTTNTSSINSVTNAVYVRRCNNLLKFYDQYHEYHEISCISEDKLVDINTGEYINLPNGELNVMVKYNNESKIIKRYDRFLLNGDPWRVEDIDKNTYVRNSRGYIKMRFKYDQINAYDDVINNISDGLKPENLAIYTIEIDNGEIAQLQIGQTLQLTSIVKKDGAVISNKPVICTTSDSNLATVDNNGVVMTIGQGNVVISVNIVDMPSIIDSFSLEIVPAQTENNYSLLIDGSTTIKNTQTLTYNASIYNNGTIDNTKSVIWSVSDNSKVQIVSQNGTSIQLKGLSSSGSFVLRATIDNRTEYIEKIINMKAPF